MNKSDLIAAVAEATGITRPEAARAVDATFEVIADALQDGADVRVIGFLPWTSGTSSSPSPAGILLHRPLAGFYSAADR